MPRVEVAELLGSRLPFRPSYPPLEPQDAPLHLHGAQRDPHHRPHEDQPSSSRTPATPSRTSSRRASASSSSARRSRRRTSIKEAAIRTGQFYVTERWLGGTLTNFTTIRKSVKRLTNIEKMETDGTFDKLTKKEILFLHREKDKLNKVLSGVVDMTRLPGALFVVDIKKEAIAVKEARRLGIPVFAIVDTNCDPEGIDYVIPANDDAIKSVQVIMKAIADALRSKARSGLAAHQMEAAARKQRESGPKRPITKGTNVTERVIAWKSPVN